MRIVRLETNIRIHSLLQGSTRVPLAAAASEAPPVASKVTAALTAVPGGVIDGGEIVLLAVKPSMWRPIFDSTPWLVTCVFLAVALTWLGRSAPGLSVTATAQVILLLALARVGVAVVRWVPTWYVLTNRRVLEIQGVRSARISACLLVDVRNTYLHHSPGEKMAKLGTIMFVSDSGEKRPLVWQSIAKPDEVHTKIRRAIENAFDQHGTTG